MPELAGVKLQFITDELIQGFITSKLLTLAPKSINNITIVFKSILKFAYKNGYINNLLEVSRVKESKQKVRVLDDDEKERLESYLVNNLNFVNFGFLLMLYTGIRAGELSALLITDINAYKGIVSITKTLQRIKDLDGSKGAKTKIVITEPKSQSSIRDVDIHEFVLKAFKQLYKGHVSGYLLTGTSQYIEPRALDTKFKKIFKKCHIEHASVHSLRHTFATSFYNQTGDIKTLSEILGHSNASITINLYVHSNLQQQKKRIQELKPSINGIGNGVA